MTTLPPRSAATQRLLLGQDTPARAVEPSTLVTVQAAAPPVGLLEVTALAVPSASTATQRVILGQGARARKSEAAASVTAHAAAAAVGLLEVATFTPTAPA